VRDRVHGLSVHSNMKRTASPEFEVAVKLQYKETDALASSTPGRPVSPPIIAKKASKPRPRLSAVEAGDASVEDHFSFFSSKLLEASRPYVSGTPRICHQAWCELYQRNLNPQGRHFVIHQHIIPSLGPTMISAYNAMARAQSASPSCTDYQVIPKVGG
jgi:hypothetical protein